MIFSVRDAHLDDLMKLFEWANSPHVRKQAFTSELITLESHEEWFKSRLGSDKCFIYIGLANEIPVGQVRFESSAEKEEYLVDIHISSEGAGKGYGHMLLKAVLEKLSGDLDKPFRAKALIFDSNIASIKCFESCRFQLLREKVMSNISCLEYVRFFCQ